MSIRKPRAPRLLPSLSNVPAARAFSSSTSSTSISSTASRIRSTACEAWSSPRTESTPRICERWLGASRSGPLSCGLRKKLSSSFSSSPRVMRNSPTTLPMVWRSLTRRYSSSIQVSSGWACPPWRTACNRSASRAVRAASWASVGSRSSNAASRYRMAVATSIASSGPGARAERATPSIAAFNASASGALGGCSFTSESVTWWNWSATLLILLASPPDKLDQVSLAITMRFRACASNRGSNRPKWLAW